MSFNSLPPREKALSWGDSFGLTKVELDTQKVPDHDPIIWPQTELK